ncbi:MAG: membrane protein insertase YidC, partial [Bryocella sp.]
MPEYKNPNQGGSGTDSRGLLVMVVVFFVAMIGVRFWAGRNMPAKLAPGAPVAQTQSATPAATAAPAAAVTATAPAAKTATSAKTVVLPTVKADAESTTVVENEDYKITFTNRGGAVTSWILKKFKTIDGQPLDMVNHAGSKAAGDPLSLYTYDADLTKSLANALYVPSATGTLQSPATLSFDYSEGNIKVHKTFTFGSDYVIHADAVVMRDGAPIRALLAWPGGVGSQETTTAYLSGTVDTSTGGKDDHISLKKVVGGGTLNGPWDFAGTSDQYFAAIFMPEKPADATLATFHTELMTEFSGNSATPIPTNQKYVAAPADNKPPKGSVILPIIGAAVGNVSGHTSLRLFVGPKSMEVLKSVHAQNGQDLGPVLDFGFWGPIAKVLFLGIQFVH